MQNMVAMVLSHSELSHSARTRIAANMRSAGHRILIRML